MDKEKKENEEAVSEVLDERTGETVKKEETSEEKNSKKEALKDETSKDETSKDETSKDETSKDAVSKDAVLKDETEKVNPGKNKSKKKKAKKEKVKKEKVKKEKKPREKLQITEEDRKVLKKQTRRLIISMVVLIVLIGAYFGLKAYSKHLSEKESSETDVLGTICNATVSDITAFHYTYDGEDYSYEKTGDTWTYLGDTSMEMDSSLIETVLGSLSGIDYYSVIDDPSDLSQYGLDADYMTVGWTEGGNTYELYVGDSNSITGYRYVMLSVSNTVYVADTTVSTGFAKTPEDFEVVEETTEEETTETTDTATDAASETTGTDSEATDTVSETTDTTAETSTDATAGESTDTTTAETTQSAE